MLSLKTNEVINKVMIIAEAGVNHNGDLALARKLIEAAADAGADFVKFQTFKADQLVSKTAVKAAYQVQNTQDERESQYTMLKKLEMPDEWHFELIEYAAEKGIRFLSTGFDESSIDFLDSLGIPFFKIPSGEITNKPYIQHVAQKGKPIILSTGMADITEVEDAIALITATGLPLEMITVLHCNTEYPTPMHEVNLLAMNGMARSLNVKVGYSDHTLGIEVPIAAVALGAVVIEKHFTLDRNLPGPDHLASLEPSELKAMVSAIRNISVAIVGSAVKAPTPSELRNRLVGRKSLHFSVSLPAGTVIKRDHLKIMRPGTGVSPMRIDDIIGRQLTSDVSLDELLLLTHLK